MENLFESYAMLEILATKSFYLEVRFKKENFPSDTWRRSIRDFNKKKIRGTNKTSNYGIIFYI